MMTPPPRTRGRTALRRGRAVAAFVWSFITNSAAAEMFLQGTSVHTDASWGNSNLDKGSASQLASLTAVPSARISIRPADSPMVFESKRTPTTASAPKA